MDCSNAVKQGMKQPGDVDAAALLDLALDEIAAVNDKEVGKPPFGVGVARISALNRLFAADLERLRIEEQRVRRVGEGLLLVGHAALEAEVGGLQRREDARGDRLWVAEAFSE